LRPHTPTRTRSLAPNTRSGRVRNVMPLSAPAPVVLAAVLRKSRRVTSDSDGIGHLLLRREPPVRFGDLRLRRISMMDQDAVAEHEHFSRGNRISAVLAPIARELSDAERIRRQKPVRARVPV